MDYDNDILDRLDFIKIAKRRKKEEVAGVSSG